MGVPLRPWTLRLLALIDQGVTAREELIRLVTPVVPIGHAYRVRVRTNERQKARKPETRTVRRREPHPKEAHRIGARQVIQKTLANLCRDQTLVLDHGHYRRAQGVACTTPQTIETRP